LNASRAFGGADAELGDDPNACAQINDMLMEMFITNQAMVDGLSRSSEHRVQGDSLRQRVVDLSAGPL
jgi:hypothetical protein